MISLENVKKLLVKYNSFALFCHVRPDGDTLGSACALARVLSTMGKRVEVFCADAIPERFSFLGIDKIVKSEFFGEYELHIAIDCAEEGRMGDMFSCFINNKNTLVIDHHISNTRFARENYVSETAANCENIYDIICELGVDFDSLTSNMLAMGILTDTGNFKHRNVTAKTLYTTSKLVEKGANLNEISYYMFTKQSKERAKLFGLVMSKIRYLLDGEFAVALISQEDLTISCAKKDETEGFIDFIMGIDQVKVGATLLELEKNKYKISLRSKGTDVNAVASVFGGGGHTVASGCQISGEYEEVVDRLRYAVKQNI